MSIAKTIDLASKLLKVDRDELEHYASDLEETDSLPATYYSIPVMGGPSLIVSDDGEVLYANSSVTFEDHIAAFKQGIRTPLDAFK